MSAFVRGIESGSRIAGQWMDTYERAQQRRQAEELKRRREEIMGAQPEDLGLRYSPEQAEQLRLAAESGQYDIGYGDDGYQVAPTADPSQVGLIAPEQRFSRFMGQEVEGSLTPQRTAEMREQALVDTIADPMERQRAMQGLRQGRLTDMQIAETERAATLRQNTDAAQQQLSKLIADGGVPDVEDIFDVAAKTNADPNELMRFTANAIGITEKKAKADTDKLVRQISRATTPAQLNNVLRNVDPDPEDDIVPELRVGRNGEHQVFYGDEPISPAFSNTRDMNAMSQLTSFYVDKLKESPFATAIQLATLEDKRAQTQKARADASAPRGIQAKIADFKVIYGREPNEDEKAILVGLQGRPGAGKLEDPTKPSAAAQARYDAIKSSDTWQQALLSGNAALQRTLLVNAGIPTNELFKFGVGEPPGQTGTGETWAPPGKTADKPADKPAAAKTEQKMGLGESVRPKAQPASQNWLAKRTQDLQAAEAELAQAQAQASAVARSGDTAAIIQYGNILNRARANRDLIFKEVSPYQ
jgi:hypothetical protein